MSVVVENNITDAAVAGAGKGIDATSPLAALRQSALADLQRMGFPSSRNEEYKHTPLTRALE